MKILMATMGLDIGGAETHIIELSKELCRQGHQVLIASAGGVYVHQAEEAGIRHFTVPMNSRNPLNMAKSYRLMKKLIAEEKPDIVHAHARIPAFICWSVGRSLSFNFVTTTHGVYDTGGGLRYITKWGRRTIAVSEDIADYLTENYGIAREDIDVTINGIDTEKFSSSADGGAIRRELGIPEKAPLVVHVSRQDPDSSVPSKQLVACAEAAAKRVEGVCFLLVGGGSEHEDILAGAQEVNRRLGRKCVVAPGARTDISEVTAAGDVFVGVSRAALEAMAEEKPVILSGNAGYMGLFSENMLEEAMDNNFCCRGCEEPSAEKLAAAIQYFFLDVPDAERKKLGAFGRSVVQRCYSVTKMAEDNLKVYREMLSPGHRMLLSGYYGFNNAGDEAILQTICDDITEREPGARITVLSKNPEFTKREYGRRAISRYNPFRVLPEIKKCDVLISGGGSLLQDKTSTRSLYYYLYIIRLAKMMRRPVMLYANGIGPVNRERNRSLMKRVLSRVDAVTVRDQDSFAELKGMGIDMGKVSLTADPAFHMRPVSEEARASLLEKAGIPADRPYAVAAIRSWPRFERFAPALARACSEIYERYGYNIVFTVMQKPHDREINRKIMERMDGGAYIFDIPCTPRDMAGVFAGAQFVFSMRYHGLVFAALGGVPMAGISYDPKMESFFREFNIPSAGGASDLNYPDVMDAITKVMLNRADYSGRIREKAAENREKARENLDILQTLLEKRER